VPSTGGGHREELWNVKEARSSRTPSPHSGRFAPPLFTHLKEKSVHYFSCNLNMPEAQMSRKFWRKNIFKKIRNVLQALFATFRCFYALESPKDKRIRNVYWIGTVFRPKYLGSVRSTSDRVGHKNSSQKPRILASQENSGNSQENYVYHA
jgi:hypothetical protein